MDLDGIMLSEMSQQRQMPYMISLYKGNLKKQNKWTYIKKTETESKIWRKNRGFQRGGALGEEGNSWGRCRGTNFQLQDKWVTVVKSIVWEIQSVIMYYLSMVTDHT